MSAPVMFKEFIVQLSKTPVGYLNALPIRELGVHEMFFRESGHDIQFSTSIVLNTEEWRSNSTKLPLMF